MMTHTDHNEEEDFEGEDADASIDDSMLDEISETDSGDDEVEGFGHIKEDEGGDDEEEKEGDEEEVNDELEDDAEDVDYDSFDDEDYL